MIDAVSATNQVTMPINVGKRLTLYLFQLGQLKKFATTMAPAVYLYIGLKSLRRGHEKAQRPAVVCALKKKNNSEA